MLQVLLLAFLAMPLAAPKYHKNRRPTSHQVRRQATQIVRYLKRTDPRILKEVLRQMKWEPKKRRIKNPTKEFDQWYIDMMSDLAGIPKIK